MGEQVVVKKLSLSIAEAIDKEYKNRSYIYYGDKTVIPVVRDVISTQAINIDLISARASNGRWGLPCGRIVYAYGKEKCGKTTLMLSIIKEVQRTGGIPFLIESESSLDVNYAEELGLNMNEVLLSQPDSLDDCCGIIESTIKTIIKVRKEQKITKDIPILIAIDSVSAFPTKAEIKDDFTKAHPGEHARLISKLCRSITAPIRRLNILMFFVLQRRSKIGIKFGDPGTFIGGDALKFHASVGFKMSRIAYLKTGGDERYGIRTKVQSEWNKCRPPMRTAEIDIIWGTGIDSDQALIDAMFEYGLITKKGSWYTWYDFRKQMYKYQGLENFVEMLGDPKVRAQMEQSLRGLKVIR